MLGKTCNHDKSFICFRWGDCPYKDLITCLKVNLQALIREHEHMKARAMAKHSDASLRWRNTAFYYKKRARALEVFLLLKHIEVPNARELAHILKERRITEEVNKFMDDVKKGGQDEEVCGDGQEVPELEGHNPDGVSK